MKTQIIEAADGNNYEVACYDEAQGWGWRPANFENLVGIDADDNPVMLERSMDPPFAFTGTWCCGASYKGTDSGIACRSCYGDVELGGGIPNGEITAVKGVDPADVAAATESARKGHDTIARITEGTR